MRYVLGSLAIVNPFIETDIDISCQQGTGYNRSFTVDSKEMSQIIVQDVRPPRTSSGSLEDPGMLRPHQRRIVQGRIWGCVEGRIPRPGRCCKGYKDVLEQRLTEDS